MLRQPFLRLSWTFNIFEIHVQGFITPLMMICCFSKCSQGRLTSKHTIWNCEQLLQYLSLVRVPVGLSQFAFFFFFFGYTAQRSARNQPGRLWCADVIGAGRKELILVALLDEMIMSCSFKDSFVLDFCYRVRQLIPFWYCARNEWEFIAIFICWYGDITICCRGVSEIPFSKNSFWEGIGESAMNC